MIIGLLRETKNPVDSRVALSPNQLAALQKRFPKHGFVVQSSDTRAFTDDDYRKAGIRVSDDVSGCDVLFGIKEVNIDTLLPDKHYFFFGHFAKMQNANRPLMQSLMSKRITFSDYEYLVDDQNLRVCAFGWWAGFVGTYYTLRGYGLRHHLYELPKPDHRFTLDKLIETLKGIELPQVKLLVTGAGRVSHGAQHVLNAIGAKRMEEKEYLSDEPIKSLSYCVADIDRLVKRKDGSPFSFKDFLGNMPAYESDFIRWAQHTDILLCCHYWEPEAPVYLSEDDLRRKDVRIRMIGDVTCDIKGSIKSTVRSSTHDDPFFDYNPVTAQEEPAFSSEKNISVMAVDTCPNALAMDTSEFFGDMLTQHVFEPLLAGESSDVINRSMILKEGKLTPRFDYLTAFAQMK